MTREQINNILTEGGVETPSKLVISALLDAINSERKTAVDEATKTATEEATAKYKDYVSKEEHDKALNEINTLKDAGAKTDRTSKYKNAKIKDKWLNYVDNLLKGSENFDEDLKKFIEENPELLDAEQVVDVVEKPKPTKTVEFTAASTSKSPRKLSGVEERFYELNPDLKPKDI